MAPFSCSTYYIVHAPFSFARLHYRRERDMIVVGGLKSEPWWCIPFYGHRRCQTLLRKMNLEP